MNFKIENWKLLVLSIFYLIFSVLSYSISKEQYLNFFMIAGIIVALVGLFQILVYFFKKDYLKPNEFSFSFGVLYLLAGVIVAQNATMGNRRITVFFKFIKTIQFNVDFGKG